MREWIFIISSADIESLGAVRCLPGLLAAADNDTIWLRGIPESLEPGDELRKLPLKKTFFLGNNNELFPTEKLTPVDVLRDLSWQPIAEFLAVTAPVSCLPGKTEEQVVVKLIPSENIRAGEALLTSLNLWKEFAENASEARLAAVHFATSEDNEILIIGTPLPPIPGKEYWINNNFLMPCGYDFELSIIGKLLTGMPGFDKDYWILFHTDGRRQKISKEYFVAGKRSAARLTLLKQESD